MAYCTPAAVRSVLDADGSTSDPGSAAGLDDITLQVGCTQASDEIDARLGVRYSTPFSTPVPALVVDVATDIAAYLSTLLFRKGLPVETTDPVYLRWVRATKILADVASGAAILPVVVPTEPLGQSVVANVVISGPLWEPEDFALRRAVDRSGWSVDRWGPRW